MKHLILSILAGTAGIVGALAGGSTDAIAQTAAGTAATASALTAAQKATQTDLNNFSNEFVQAFKTFKPGTQRNIWFASQEQRIKTLITAIAAGGPEITTLNNAPALGRTVEAYHTLISLPDSFGIVPKSGINVAALAKQYAVAFWARELASAEELAEFPVDKFYVTGNRYVLQYTTLPRVDVEAAAKRLNNPAVLSNYDQRLKAAKEATYSQSLATGRLDGDYVEWFKAYVVSRPSLNVQVATLKAELKSLAAAPAGTRRDNVAQDYITTLQILQASAQ